MKATRRDFLMLLGGALGSGALSLADGQIIPDMFRAPRPWEAHDTFWSKKLLQAIAAAVDREELVNKVFGGQFTPAYHQVPPGYPFATQPFAEKYGTRNLEMSMRLLGELGYTKESPFVFDLWWPTRNVGEMTAVTDVIKKQLEQTGLIRVNLKNVGWSEYIDRLQEGKLGAFFLVWTPDFVDADNWLSPFAATLQSNQQGVFFSDPAMDKLLLDAASSASPALRAELYEKVGKAYADNVVTLPLYWRNEFVAFHEGVNGFAVGPPFEFNYHVLSFGPGAQPVSGGKDTMVIGSTYEVQSLDAQDAHTRSDWEILKNTGTAMMSYKPGTAELIPGVAEAFPEVRDDGTTYIYTLRKGVKFADGTPLTAQNYAMMWRRVSDLHGQVATLMLIYVKSLETAGDRKVIFRLRHPCSFFNDVAATPVFIPANPKQFTVDRLNRFPKILDGVGIYRLASYTRRGDRVFALNPHYQGPDKAIIPNIIVRFFPDSKSMATAVEERKIDIGFRTMAVDEANLLRSNGKVTVQRVMTPTLQYITFNHAFRGV